MADSDISTNMAGPQRMRVDGVTVQEHDLDQQIEAQRFLDEQAARNKRKLPIRLMKIKPGGAP